MSSGCFLFFTEAIKMKLGIIGLPGSGKATVFDALTRQLQEEGKKTEARLGTVKVPDTRVDILSDMYQPRKTIYAQVEYYLPAKPVSQKEQNIWTQVRDSDAFIQVIRNFSGYGTQKPAVYNDYKTLDQDMILTDQMVIEKRLERINQDKKKGKPFNPDELSLLETCLTHLEKEIPLRRFNDIAGSHLLRGYGLVSAKPLLVLFNNTDEENDLPEESRRMSDEICMIVKGKLEQELAQMSDTEAADFLKEFNITASATDRVIKASYELLGLSSFFTVGEDEVRAWTIKKETEAVDAAEVIHSDIKKGFIRAEVVSYDDLIAAGSYQEAKKKAAVRLEGKTYPVKDGDIINFRFNV